MFVATCLLLAIAPLPQESADPVVARFRYPDGRQGAVTRTELAREVAQRHRRTSSGEEALKFLVDLELVQREAHAKGVAPSREETARRIEGLRAQLEQQGMSLDDVLADKRLTLAEFEQKFVTQEVALGRLVMLGLGTEDPAEVTDDLKRLWLEEARTRHRVVTDEAELPAGVVAIVGERRFDLADLGRALLPNVPDDEREKYVRRIVLRALIGWEAERAGIRVDEADTRAEVERRRTRIEHDPRYRGVSYADWLRTTQGMTVDELARSEHMVATVQQQQLVDAAYPREVLEKRLQEDREAVLRRHGERRGIELVLLRAAKEPNALIDRTFEAAREEAERLRKEIEGGEPFSRIAQIHSEDPYSKVRGGDVGEFARDADELPDEVLEAAFTMPLLEVSEPIRVPQGYVLVRATKVVPAPDDDALIEALREEAAQRYLAERLEAAALEMVR